MNMKNEKKRTYSNHYFLLWIRNTIRFECMYRLIMIIIVHPLTNALLNYYISQVNYQSSLTNYTIFSAFLTPFGIFVLLIIALTAVLSIVFELLTMLAMTYCMLHKIEYTTSSLYSTTFAMLRSLRHPSSFFAPIYFAGLLPFTHIGYLSTYLTTLRIPNFITNELSMTTSGKVSVLFFFILAFILYGLFVFVPVHFFKQETSFWKACKKSICEVLHSSIRTKIKLSFLLLVGFISNIIVLRWLQVPVLKNSDFNIYLFRYLFHSYHFRIQFICTIFFWIFLYVLSLFFLVCILKMYEREQETINFTLKKEDRPFFAYRISSLFKHSAKHVRRYFLEYYTHVPHRKIVILILCQLMLLVMFQYLNQKPLLHSPWIIGHRGDNSAPENSLLAIQRAQQHGANYAEIDIQLTADGQQVVFHDSSTKRLAAQDLSIHDHTLQELQKVQLSSHGQSYYMPSLQEAIQTAKQTDPAFGLLIELKPKKGEEQKMVNQLIELIEKNHFEERAIFMSIDYEAVTLLQHLRPEWWIGYCVFGSLGKIDYHLDVDFLAVEEEQINTRFLEQARKNGIPVYIWTVNNYYDVLNYLRMGVSGIIGDDVKEMHRAMKDYQRYDEQTYFYEGEGYPH